MKGTSIIYLVILLVVFYVLMFLPQRRQQKQKQTMMASLGPGAKVLTSGGIYGQVVSIHDSVIVAKIAHDVEIELDSRAIIRVVEPGFVEPSSVETDSLESTNDSVTE